jgi:hypothetical protein
MMGLYVVSGNQKTCRQQVVASVAKYVKEADIDDVIKKILSRDNNNIIVINEKLQKGKTYYIALNTEDENE